MSYGPPLPGGGRCGRNPHPPEREGHEHRARTDVDPAATAAQWGGELGAAGGRAAAGDGSRACRDGADRRALAAGAPKKGGTLTFARSVAPTQLDPANSIIAGDVYTLDKIMEPLYLTSPAGELIPWLAESHTTSADGLTWTFTLRPGRQVLRRVHRSPPADVVFSIQREAATDAAARFSSFLDFAIKTLKATGPSTVALDLCAAPWAPFLSDISVFANAILPADFGGERPRRPSSAHADRHGAVRARLFHPEQQPHAEAQPALLAGWRSIPATTRRTTRARSGPRSRISRIQN